LAVRAVVFDYGMVLSGPPHPPSRKELERITGLSKGDLDRYYWVDRHAYDRGDLTGLGFWQKLSADAGLALTDEQIHELNQHDAQMWTTENPVILAWQKQLRSHGLKTAILSNMGDTVLASIESSFSWVDGFDVLLWSYQHRMAKPEPEIYELLLEKLGTAPKETLFLDDKLENIEAAQKAGIQGLVFSDAEQLRTDLVAAGYDAWLPLP
jgi:putative hydrolase of the HAD superfamily